jgi:hypothetical protein
MMTKRNRNIKNIFIRLQMGTNIMLYENLTFEIPPLWFFRVVEG